MQTLVYATLLIVCFHATAANPVQVCITKVKKHSQQLKKVTLFLFYYCGLRSSSTQFGTSLA